MERFHEAGIIVIPVVPSVALAKRMEKSVQTLLLQKEWKLGAYRQIDNHDLGATG